MKIIQHANDMSPNQVSGQLVGMTLESGVMEVTDMFPSQLSMAEDEDPDEYVLEMLKAFRDVNVDHNTVGWYQSINLDAPIQPSFIEGQAAYQSGIPNSCLIVYDHGRSAQGVPYLRAFRLTDIFLRAWRDSQKYSGRISHGLLRDLVGEGIFLELPVKIHVSSMDKLLLSSMIETGECPVGNVVGSENSIRLVLSRLAQNLLLSLDDSISESSRVQHYIKTVNKQKQHLASQIAKRRADGLPEDDLTLNLKGISDPSRLGLLYSSEQLGSLLEQCDEVFQVLQAKQSI